MGTWPSTTWDRECTVPSIGLPLGVAVGLRQGVASPWEQRYFGGDCEGWRWAATLSTEEIRLERARADMRSEISRRAPGGGLGG